KWGSLQPAGCLQSPVGVAHLVSPDLDRKGADPSVRYSDEPLLFERHSSQPLSQQSQEALDAISLHSIPFDLQRRRSWTTHASVGPKEETPTKATDEPEQGMEKAGNN